MRVYLYFIQERWTAENQPWNGKKIGLMQVWSLSVEEEQYIEVWRYFKENDRMINLVH